MARKALCIGINNYPGTHMDLQGCVNDAQDWTDVLQSRGFVISALLDQQATKAAMMSAMRDLINNAVAGDSLVITFSGHGTYQPDKDGDEVDGLDKALGSYAMQTEWDASTVVEFVPQWLHSYRENGCSPRKSPSSSSLSKN